MSTYAVLQIVNMLVGLFLPRLYLAVYGSEINGIVSTINSFTSYFTYLEAGLGLTLIHSLFRPLVNNNTDDLNSILSYSKKQYQKISYIYLALVVILSFVFPFLTKANDIGTFEFISLVLVIGLYGAIDFYTMAKYRVLLTADRKEYVISISMIIAQILRFIFVFILLKFNLSVVLVKIVPIFTLFIRTIILRVYIKRKYKHVDYSCAPSTDISVSANRWDALLLQISISTSTTLPTIIISQILGFKEANVFSVYSLVTSSMIAIVSALSSGVSPMLGKDIAKGLDIKKTYCIYDHTVAFILSVLFSITGVMMIPFVKLYTNVVSDINYIHPEYALLFSIWAALYSYRIPITAVTNAAAVYKENRFNNTVNLIMQVVLGIIATLIWGIFGLLIVMIISAVQRNICLSISNSKKLLHIGITNPIIYQTLITLLITATYFISYNFISSIEFTLFIWVGVAIIVATIILAICLLVYSLIYFELTMQIFKIMKNKIRSILKIG